MENYFKFKGLAENDVIEFGKYTYRIKKIIDALTKKLSDNLGRSIYDHCHSKEINIYPPNHNFSSYFNEGLDCQMLKIASPDWQKGKLKINISVEFIPESIEEENKSELDTVREVINNQS